MKAIFFLKILFYSLFLAFCSGVFSLPARADIDYNLSVTPSVIDVPSCEKGRICLEKKISIKNNSEFRADVYVQVNDLSPDNGLIRYNDPSELPADASLTRWIEFYRAVITIMPGETATQTLKIIASPNAIPGKYHALISFPSGINMTEAQQADAKFRQQSLALNVEIKAHTVEQAEVSQFAPVKNFFRHNPIGFLLKVKNIGNEAIAPVGEIVIYNKGGKEVGSIAVKERSISPLETADFSTAGDLKLGPGKYKAKLSLNYGQSNKDLSDITYFSYLPTAWFLTFLAILLFFILAGVLLIRKKRREKGVEPEDEEDEEAEEEEEAPAPQKLSHKKYVINLKKR